MAIKLNRTKEIHGLRLWYVNDKLDKNSNKIPLDNGYFGAYTLITYRRKQAVVYVDSRDAIVNVITDWHDKIFYGREFNRWDGDYRWNHDKPLVIKNRGKFNINGVHNNKLLIVGGVKEIIPNWKYDKTLRVDYLDGTDNDGNSVMITAKGSIIQVGAENATEVLEKIQKYSINEIISKWIEIGKPCAYIRGLEYKGAKVGLISKERAMELIKTNNRFGGMFNSAEWTLFDGRVTLLFRDYADSDYD